LAGPQRAEVDGRCRQINSALNNLEAAGQQTTLTSYPPLIQISTGSRCNLRCIFCTERGPRKNGVYENLSLKDFIPLTDALPYATTIQLNGWGEPLFNPEYKRIFDHIKENHPGVRIHLSTNGTLLGPAWQKRFVDYGNISLNVSINAATRETYRDVARKDLFERLMANLTAFGDRREEAGIRDKTNFSCSFVVMRQNLSEMPRFVDLAATLKANRVQFMDLMHLTRASLGYSVAGQQEETERYLRDAMARGKHHGITVGSFLNYATNDCLSVTKAKSEPAHAEIAGDQGPAPRARLLPCYSPWNSLMTTMDGGVHPCCRSNTVLGNLRQESIAAIWNGQRYRDFRARVNSDNPPEECRRCPVKFGLSAS
jgi:radical SAM protein with 4Fe4S-binding SPASM domain